MWLMITQILCPSYQYCLHICILKSTLIVSQIKVLYVMAIQSIQNFKPDGDIFSRHFQQNISADISDKQLNANICSIYKKFIACCTLLLEQFHKHLTKFHRILNKVCIKCNEKCVKYWMFWTILIIFSCCFRCLKKISK